MNKKIKDATYEFPPLTQKDINQLQYYDLKLIKKENDGCCVVEGRKIDLMRYADEYLDYDLHPDYLVDSKPKDSKVKDADYSKITELGYPIIAKYKDGNRIHVIVKRSRDYVVGLGYDESDGEWSQGRYDFPTFESAEKGLFEEKGRLTKIGDSKVKDETKIMWGADKVKDKDKIDTLIKLGATSSDLGKYILLRGPISIFVKGLGMSEEKIRMYANMDMSTINIDDSKRFTKQEIKDLHKLADALKARDLVRDSKTKDNMNDELLREVKELLQDNGLSVSNASWNGKQLVVDTSNNSKAFDVLRRDYAYNDVVKVGGKVGIIFDSKVKDSPQTDIFNEIKSKYPGVKFTNVIYKEHPPKGKEFYFTIEGDLPQGLNRFDHTKKESFERFVEYVMKQHGYKNPDVNTDNYNGLKVHVRALVFDFQKDSLKSYKVNGKIVKATDEFHAIRKYQQDSKIKR